MTTLEQAIALGKSHLAAGRLAEAEQVFRSILARESRSADAWHFLGLILCQTNRAEEGFAAIRRSIEMDPQRSFFHSNLGEMLRAAGQFDEAISECRKGVELDPNLPDVHVALGSVLQSGGQVGEAIESFRRAVLLQSKSTQALFRLASALQDSGKIEEAVSVYSQLIQLAPNSPDAHYNLGKCFQRLNRIDKAIESFNQAIQLQASHAAAWNELGNCFTLQNNGAQAAACYHRAVLADPTYAAAWNNLAVAMASNGQRESADKLFARSLELDPNYALAWCNRSDNQRELGQLEQAVASAGRAIELQPKLPAAHGHLASALAEMGKIDDSIRVYREGIKLDPTVPFYSNLLLTLQSTQIEPADLYQEHVNWARSIPIARANHTNTRDPDRKLKIGYVSPDFRGHSVAFFIEGILANHDSQRFEITCYSDVHNEDATTARLKSLVPHWKNWSGIDDQQAIEQVRADEIDILIDLAGHSAYNRLRVFAAQAAPIQITYLGYPATTGLSTVQYRLTDEIADPPGQTEPFHTEALLRLPAPFLCYTPPNDSPEPAPPQPDAPVTFGSFNTFRKITQEMLEIWSRILLAVPDSKLLLKAQSFRSDAVRADVHSFFEKAGTSPQRITLLPHTGTLQEHLSLYNRVDIALDTYPYNGATTTCEALWMGVPAVTLAGKTHVSRVGATLLTATGMAELIAQDSDGYVQIATKLAADRSRLNQLSIRDRMKNSRLTDARSFTRELEATYRGIWKRYCERG